jgi:hypothetical protein
MANRSRTEIVSQILETIYDHDGDVLLGPCSILSIFFLYFECKT